MAGDGSPGRLRPEAFLEAPQKWPNRAARGGRGGTSAPVWIESPLKFLRRNLSSLLNINIGLMLSPRSSSAVSGVVPKVPHGQPEPVAGRDSRHRPKQ